MNILVLVGATFLSLAAAKDKGEAPAADPNAGIAKEFGGKVWVNDDSIRAAKGDELRAWLTSHKPAIEVARKTKDGPWTISFLAVFKKPSVKGPMTVQYFEKGDAKNIVDQYSPPNEEASVIFLDTHDLEPDHGFNKGKTYVIKVGQIIKGKFVPYATGELTTK